MMRRSPGLTLSHAHPAVADAVDAQMRRLVHVSNLYHVEHRAELAEHLGHDVVELVLDLGVHRQRSCDAPSPRTPSVRTSVHTPRRWGELALDCVITPRNEL